ncbi:hypothetical protein HBI82_241260 [Parastagonospora nodorum]|nr:hypothetical protein HBH94_237160 [Parastagonospora nodorum]KAH4645303.1 hypothetical protein HBH80_242350 [Parastagonospora nodorum]KAH4735906.1 hypothetical protein HBH65_234330 [Parastagonospora nodorum]KAH4952577.1 hypothetical protein HBI78_239560 [Parastagonospora nodorum]KAH5045940.1 hypothetical protein HBH96_241590 [Parastagonospora nodorum]
MHALSISQCSGRLDTKLDIVDLGQQLRSRGSCCIAHYSRSFRLSPFRRSHHRDRPKSSTLGRSWFRRSATLDIQVLILRCRRPASWSSQKSWSSRSAISLGTAERLD